jgi:exodeoxyribonuclease VII large subunit
MDLFNQSQAKIFTVSSLSKEIQDLLQERYDWVQVKGEISNLKPAASGHWYFSLKDKDAVISCVAWRSTAARWSGLKLKDGMEVVAGGSISLYPPRGQYQLVVTSLRLEGVGALQVQYEELKRQLYEEGLFDEAHKQDLPFFPKKIAVVTSPTGAALRDFLRVLQQYRCPVPVMVCPVLVQGNEAAGQIADMLDWLNQQNAADVIVVTRGGGSLEDLWAFNEEAVARAIYHSNIPVISAVGHEIDTTISDYAADFRAPTPTAAAQSLSHIYMEHQGKLHQYFDQMQRAVLPLLKQEKERISVLTKALRRYHPQTVTSVYKQKLDDWFIRLSQRMAERIAAEKKALQIQQSALSRTIYFSIKQQASRIDRIRKLLESHELHKTLSRGYAICRDGQGNIIMDVNQVKSGDGVSIRLAHGKLNADVTEVET